MTSIPLLLDYTSEQRHSQYAEICAADGLKRLSLIEALPGYIGTNQETQERRQQTNWCDLAAQESVANSARWSTISAWAITALTLVGVIFLARTLQYTRRTLDEAKEATRAANKHVEIAREEQRPWLTFDVDLHGDFLPTPLEPSVVGYDLSIDWGINYSIQNRGKGTAVIRETRIAWICSEDWIDAERAIFDLIDGKIGHRVQGEGHIFAGEKTGKSRSIGSMLISKETPTSQKFAFLFSIAYTDLTNSINGIDARTFVLQQLGPKIGPWVTEYRNSPRSRVIR